MKTPKGFEKALKGIVTSDGWITWDIAVKSVKIVTKEFHTNPGVKIPAVKITIKLNEGYTAIDGTNKLLSFDSGDLGLTVNTSPAPLENAEDILIAELKKR